MVTRLRRARLLVLSTMVVGSAWLVGCGSDDPAATDTGDAAADAHGDGGLVGDSAPSPDSGTPVDVGDTGTPGSPDGGSDASDGAPDGTAAEAGSPPAASFPTGAIDFGLSDCGGAAATKTLVIQNNGGLPLTVTATTAAPFAVTTASPLTIAPNATGTLTLTATVPASSTAGTATTGVLILKTNDAAKASTNVNLSVTPQGAQLAFATGSATSAAFGTAKVNVAAPNQTLTLKNTGNKAAAFSFGTPADAQFSLATAPASAATLNTNDTVTVTAGFKPASLASATSSSTITATGAVCAGSASTIAFSGQGSSGVVTGWPTAVVNFGAGTCGGTAPAAKTFTLANAGGVDVAITSVAFTSAVGYTTDLTVGKKVPAGGTLVVTVTPPAIPTPSVIPGNYADTLKVTTDIAGDAAHVISLDEKAQGAVLAFDTSATANFGAFSAVPVGSTATQPFSIVNTGTGPATVALSTTGPFGVTTSSVTVAAGTPAGDAVTFAPAGIAPQTGSIAISPAAGICQPLPAPIALTGAGLNGGIFVMNTSLSFTPACGTTASAQSFTITNNGNVPTTWTGSLGKQGAAAVFTVSPTTSTLQPNETVTVTVTPMMIPAAPVTVAPSAFSDVFTISAPSVIGAQPQVVTLSQVPLGAVLTVAPLAGLPFGNVPVNTTSPAQAFTLTNAGNLGSPTPAVTLTSSAPALFPLVTGTLSVPAGGTATTNVTFVPGAVAVPQLGNTITFVIGGANCGAPLPPLPVSGTGTSGPVLDDESPFAFGAVNCNGVAPAQFRDIENGGPTDFHVTSIALGKGAASPFTLTYDPASLLVTANGTGVRYTITPKAIPQYVPASDLTLTATTYSDTLTFTTDAPNDVASHVIPLNMGAQGVILSDLQLGTPPSIEFGTVPVGSQSTLQTPVTNSGNVPVTFSLNVDPSIPAGTFVLPPGQNTIAPHTTQQLGAVFTPQSSGKTISTTGNIVVAPGTVLCQPLPASYSGITVRGISSP